MTETPDEKEKMLLGVVLACSILGAALIATLIWLVWFHPLTNQ
jgi:hypothetical protein